MQECIPSARPRKTLRSVGWPFLACATAALSLGALFIILVSAGDGDRGVDATEKAARVLSFSGWVVASVAAAIFGSVGLWVAGRFLNVAVFVAWYAVSQIAFAIMLGAAMGPLNEFTLLLLLAITYAVGGVLGVILTRSFQKAAP